jgi:5-hydroxyisourate hydrolase-like protein (transthyretin family)
MKTAPLLFGLVFLAATGIPQEGYQDAPGLIFGHVVDQNGQPAKGVELEAMPLGVVLATVLPRSRTDENGNYRIAAPWWGRYTVYAEDPDAGYSQLATYRVGPNGPAEVTISRDHPQAEFNFQLPPKAGFLHFHLTDQTTGRPIHGIEVTVLLKEQPPRPVYSSGTSADKPFLVPSDRDILIHVTSWGYKEWNQSAGAGKAIRLSPGAELTLDVSLEPAAN